MRIVLFEPVGYAHSAVYLHRMADALQGWADVTLAVPDELASGLRDAHADVLAVGPAPQPPDVLRPFSPELRRLTSSAVERFNRAIAATAADHGLVLSADLMLRALFRHPAGRTGTALLVFRPRAHYPSTVGSSLRPKERIVGEASEILLRRWRRRRDALALFSLDPVAVGRWAAQPGAPAIWLPEPPVLAQKPQLSDDREGMALVGSIARRKGIAALADAASGLPRGARLVLAGSVAAAYGPELRAHVAAMRASGMQVDSQDRKLSEPELLAILAGARCALLPYERHIGMSRVLLEAAVAETPVVVNDFGLLSHLVRRHELGVAVDCSNPRALARALTDLLRDPQAVRRYAPKLRRFASRFSEDAFAQALSAPFRTEWREGSLSSMTRVSRSSSGR